MSTEPIFDLCRKLANIRRFSREFSHHPESVLEHTGFVALYSLAIGTRAVAAGYPVDFADLLSKALLHDIEESVTGDVPRITKYFSKETKEALEKFDKIAALSVCERIAPNEDWKGNFHKCWANAKDDTITGQIVAVADLAAAVYHLENELVNFSNLSFRRVCSELNDFLQGKYLELRRSNSKFNSEFLTEIISEYQDKVLGMNL